MEQLDHVFRLKSGSFYEKKIGLVPFDVSNRCVNPASLRTERWRRPVRHGGGNHLGSKGEGRHFEITGNNDEVTIAGNCSKVEVLGHNNKITLDAVGIIQLVGDNNLVTYRQGLNGAHPKIETAGENNQVVPPKE